MSSLTDSETSLNQLAPRLRDGIALSINAQIEDPYFFIASYLLRTSGLPLGSIEDLLDSSACPLDSVLQTRPFDASETPESISVEGLTVPLHPTTIAAREQAATDGTLWVLQYGKDGVSKDVREK